MKSLVGYSDMDGVDGWVSGHEKKGYMALFRVNVGRQLDLARSGDHKKVLKVFGSLHDLSGSRLMQNGYDTVYVHRGFETPSYGTHIYNDEFIIFTPDRCTIAAIVEVIPA